MEKLVIFFAIALGLAVSHCQNVTCDDPVREDHSCLCEAPDEEMQQLDCQCEPADGEGHFLCDCWANQDPHPAHYLDCLAALREGQTESGIYNIKPNSLDSFEVYCDMETEGGGWTVFQRRVDGSVDFYRSWHDYVHGFGSLEGEHWLGLSKILRLANSSVPNELQVDMGDFEGNTRYARYSSFYIEGSSADYKLHVSGYSGSAGDSFTFHNGKKFTTKENDNDDHSSNCAVLFSGAWWYLACHRCNPNGLYGHNEYGKGINWYNWKGYEYSLKYIQFKIRRP